MGQEGQRGFSAFVSYSHADKAAAQKLHRRLESYRLPKHVAAQLAATTLSDDPTKLGQIFRDREDLPAAQDLSESVKAALQVSRALIVLCSPAAKASKWVAREIETFRLLHPDRPILAALLEGEPEEAFPEPLLQGREPLAADLRKEGDGPRLGFLKVVAGIAGVPLDALVQRDAQRRMRRVMAVTAGAVTAMLAMAIMTFIAIQSRNEAQRQRAEAEGLVEYMLTDLRDELKGVGRLDVMTDVNERAMDYYEGQGDLSDMPAESLERRARILHAMGEDDEKRGDLKKALAKFTEAHRVTESLLARDSDNPDRIFGHAQSEFWIGYVAYLKKDWDAAEIRFGMYQQLAKALVKNDSTNPKWLRELGYAEGNRCSIALHSPTTNLDSVGVCEVALNLMQKISVADPEDQKTKIDLANRMAWVADAYWLNQETERAIAIFTAQHDLLENMNKNSPENMTIIDIFMRSKMTLAEKLNLAGRTEKAEIARLKALSLADIMVNRDPKNKRWSSWKKRIEKNEIYKRTK